MFAYKAILASCVFNEGLNTSPRTVNNGDNPPWPTAKAFLMVQGELSRWIFLGSLNSLFFPSLLFFPLLFWQ